MTDRQRLAIMLAAAKGAIWAFRIGVMKSSRVIVLMILAATAIFDIIVSASAQTDFRTLNCQFRGGTSAKFDKDWDVKAAADKLNLTFENIDLAQAKARVVGPFGMTNVLLFRGNGSLNFLEIMSDGNQTFTTVFFSYQREGKQRGAAVWYPAVHSRHMMIGSNPVVSHLRGFCQPN
jgi:hypothetical protein